MSAGLVIVDLNLPDINGFEVISNLRRWSEIPIIVLSGARPPLRQVVEPAAAARSLGPAYDDATGNLRLYMAQHRRKLEPDPPKPRWLLTEPGMGYRFQPEP